MRKDGKIRLGIIGCGGICRYMHLPAYVKDPRVEFVVACDLIEGRAQKVCKEFNIPNLELDYKKVIDNYELDAISVCTSNDAHGPISIYAAKAGLNILCEKPMALNLDEAGEMLEAVKAAGVVHLVDFSKRFSAASRYLREKLLQGELGDLFAITVDYYQGYRANPDMPVAWRVKKDRAGSGVLGDLGSHCLDIVRFWSGEPKVVKGYTKTIYNERPCEDGRGTEIVDADDLAWIIGETETGTPFSVRTTWNRADQGDTLTAEIACRKGTYLWDFHKRNTVAIHWDLNGPNKGRIDEIQIPESYDVNPFRLFIDHCLSGEPIEEPTFEDGYNVQKILDAVLRDR